MQLFHFYHNHNLREEIKSDFWLFEFSVWLHTIARSLVAVFVPIFLLQIGYGLPVVIWYYVLFNAIDVPLNFAVERLMRRIGARRIIILASFASVIYFTLLSRVAGGSIAILALLALLDAIYDTFYWIGHIYLFLNSKANEKESSRKTGLLYSIRLLGSMLGPLIGAGLLLFTSQGFLLLASVLFFIFSILPLIDLRHIADRPRAKHISFREFFRSRIERRDYLSMFLNSIHGASEGVIWPLFIFSLFGTIRSVAYIAIMVSISQIICSYITGKVRKSRRRGLMLIGGLALAATWLVRLFFPTPGIAYTSVLVAGFLALFVDIPIDTSLFARGQGNRALATATYRNASSMFGQLVLYLILALSVTIFKVDFALAASGMLLLAVISSIAFGPRRPRGAEAVAEGLELSSKEGA